MAAAAMWKITKIAISPNGLTDLYEIWYADAKWVSYPPWPLKKFEFHKSKMADGRHFKNRYIILSQQPFD